MSPPPVLDAETKPPLGGVVVVAEWTGRDSHNTRYYDSEEVVTGPDGSATIPARSLSRRVDAAPALILFKPGYRRTTSA